MPSISCQMTLTQENVIEAINSYYHLEVKKDCDISVFLTKEHPQQIDKLVVYWSENRMENKMEKPKNDVVYNLFKPDCDCKSS